MICRRPGGRRTGRFAGQRPPDLNDFPPAGEAGGKTINDFLNDFPPAGEVGGKIINDFINDFPPARRPAEKNPKFSKIITVPTTTTAGL